MWFVENLHENSFLLNNFEFLSEGTKSRLLKWGFHCFSEKNDSDLRRWVMITSMNTRKNSPIKKCPFPTYKPMKIIPNSEILNFNENSSKAVDKEFLLNSADDNSTASISKK